MRGAARFQSDPGRCQPVEELPHLAAPELTPDNRLLVLIDAVHLKDVLGGIQTNSDNRHGTAPLAALHTSQPGTINAVGGRPPQHHTSGNRSTILYSASAEACATTIQDFFDRTQRLQIESRGFPGGTIKGEVDRLHDMKRDGW